VELSKKEFDTPNWKCPACEGKGFILVSQTNNSDGKTFIEWLQRPCIICNGTGFIK
jgi:hypothetical protein